MDDDVLSQARRLAQTLRPGDLDDTLTRITLAAVEVLPEVGFASITVRHADGRLETVAPSDDSLMKLDAAQYSVREGPCYETATDEAYVVSSDLASDPRWPQYTQVALEAGIRAQAGIGLFDAERFQGALNLYSREVGAFQDMGPVGQLFSHQAALAIGYAQEVSDLRQAVLTRQRIGQAMGVVMERYHLTEDRAFAFLTRLSQGRNVKIRDLALEFIAGASEGGDDDSTPR